MYTITFEDGEVWQGGTIEQSNWNLMPNKRITNITYKLMGKSVYFEGYEKYNHLVERVSFILNNNQKERISKVLLMAKKNNLVYTFIFDLFNKEICSIVYEFGKEYYGKATIGWKEGLVNKEVIYRIED